MKKLEQRKFKEVLGVFPKNLLDFVPTSLVTTVVTINSKSLLYIFYIDPELVFKNKNWVNFNTF